VGPDTSQIALWTVGEAPVQLRRDGQAEHAVAQELKPLVGLRTVRSPRGVRERRGVGARWKLVYQRPQAGAAR
jgi:hypothetical protein